MNIISKIKEAKREKLPIKIVINSNYDYKNHDLNVLKECLNLWSEDQGNHVSPFEYKWIFCNPEYNEKMFFITTSIMQLKKMHLINILNEDKIKSETFMDSEYNNRMFCLNMNSDNYTIPTNKNVA